MNFNNIEFIKSIGSINDSMPGLKQEIVFSGKSNVGKSSLINKLFNRKKIARISSKPGKTVTLNFFKCENVNFVDLPGYGFAKASFKEKERWSKLVEDYFNLGRKISLVIQILDSRHPPTALDFQMLDFLTSKKIPFILVLSKSDKLNKTDRSRRLNEFENELKNFKNIQKIWFSAVNSEGLEELKNAIFSSLGEI